MSLATLGCLGIILALLGALVIAPLLLVTGVESQPQPPEPFDYSGTNNAIVTAIQATSWQIGTIDAQLTAEPTTFPPTATLAPQQ
ncbi:MAG: hypothetical protein K8L91_12595 [Anaerolineae bacterium]|nr:hypothetical protein [Anaerolineae bacterium]